MPAWADLLAELDALPNDQARSIWLRDRTAAALKGIGQLRGGKNVLVYASAFLQKPQTPAPMIQITHEEINAFMSSLYGMDCGVHPVSTAHPGDVRCGGRPHGRAPAEGR